MARLLSLVAVLVSCAASAPAQTATLTMLPEEFEVYDLSGDGRVVVGWVTNVTPRYAATWTREAGLQAIPKPPSWGATLARAVNHDGNVIAGEAATPEGVRAFVYKPETGMVSIGVLPETSSSISLGVSSNGEWMCGWSGRYAYRYHVPTGVMERLADPGYPNDSFNATAISNSGIVVGAAFSSKGGTADPYEWPTPSQARLLDPPGGNVHGRCVAITPDGQWIAGTTDSPLTGILPPWPVLWTDTRSLIELVSMGTPHSSGVFVRDLSDDGHIVVSGIRVPRQPQVAGVWTRQTQTVRLWPLLETHFGLTSPHGEPVRAERISGSGRVLILEWEVSPVLQASAIVDWPPPCAADCELDWQLDIFDFLCFMNKYVENDPYACDFNERTYNGYGGGACTIHDLLAFQRRFVEGCR